MGSNEDSKGAPVILHIYDVPNANQYIHIFTDKYGIYHTGVEVFRIEYSFGGHPHEYSGIFKTPPKDIRTLSVSDTFRYKESKKIGFTKKSEEEIKEIINEFGKEFRGKDYNLIRRNCNHFSNAFCKKICGKSIPEWVNSVVQLIQQYPALEQQIPKEFITPSQLDKNVKNIEKERKNKKNKKKKKKTTSTTAATTTPMTTPTATATTTTETANTETTNTETANTETMNTETTNTETATTATKPSTEEKSASQTNAESTEESTD